jgi:hypothetical protein
MNFDELYKYMTEACEYTEEEMAEIEEMMDMFEELGLDIDDDSPIDNIDADMDGEVNDEDDVNDLEEMKLKFTSEEDPCWDDYEMVGMKDKDGKKVPNCVPKESDELEEEVSRTAAQLKRKKKQALKNKRALIKKIGKGEFNKRLRKAKKKRSKPAAKKKVAKARKRRARTAAGKKSAKLTKKRISRS